MNEPLSGNHPAVSPRTISATLFHAVQRDALVAAVGLGLLPATSYDVAWDALEDASPGRYQPDNEFSDWLRANWRDVLAGALVPAEPAASPQTENVADVAPHAYAHARPWMVSFLAEYIRNGGIIIQAAKVALVNRDTVIEHRKRDPVFARALLQADEERRRRAGA